MIWKHFGFICCRKQRTWKNRVSKAKPHPITLQTYFLLSHPYLAITYFLEFKFIFPFFWSLCSFFWIVFQNFCREDCGEKRTSQLTKSTICHPCSCFKSSEYWKILVWEVLHYGFLSAMQGSLADLGKSLSEAYQLFLILSSQKKSSSSLVPYWTKLIWEW